MKTRIQELRKIQKVTQMELAESVGADHYLSGKRQVQSLAGAGPQDCAVFWSNDRGYFYI